MKDTRAKVFLTLSLIGLSNCSGLDNTITDPVQWWAINGWDNNCSRHLRDISFKSHEEIKVISCGDGQGRANVRFRREGYASRQDSWSRDTAVRLNQRTIVR
jgi:hypothetical protein